MNEFTKSMLNMNDLEQLAGRKGKINELPPVIKILFTLGYILLVVSAGKFQLTMLLYLLVYPVVMLPVLDVGIRQFMSKLVLPVVFSFGLGIANPILDRSAVMDLGFFTVTGGMISMTVLFLKAVLTVSATLLLVSTTTVTALGHGLMQMKVPKKLVMLLMLMYRYIGVLLDETGRTIEAYQLRTGSTSIHISSWGSLVGQIFIRAYKRSEEIYNAMCLRGYGTGDDQQ